MAEGDNRRDIIFPAGGKHPLVKAQAFLVWLCVVAVGEDAAPRDGQAQAFETNLAKQRNVFFEAVVKVDAGVGRKILIKVEVLDEAARLGAAAGRQVVGDAFAFAAFVPGAFTLIGSQGGPPRENYSETAWALTSVAS